LIHDDHIDETTDGTGVVSEMTLEELRRFDAGAWKEEAYRGERIPTLREALDLARNRAALNLDLKTPEAIPAMLAEVKDAGMLREVVVTGCNAKWVGWVRACDPTVPVFLNWGGGTFADNEGRVLEAIAQAQQAQVVGLNCNHRVLTPAAIGAARKRALAVWAWTVDDPQRMEELIQWGVDALTSNYPARLLRLLGRLPDGATP